MQTTLILVSILTIGFVVGVNSGKACGNSPADVVFVLDESSSIYPKNFTLQLQFVQSLTDDFDVHFDRTRVGVLTFATKIRIIFPLGRYTEEKELKKAINDTKQSGGDTFTHSALKSLREEMFSAQIARPGVRHVAIVITDGASSYPEKTKVEAGLIHKTDIEIFAIGVGNDVKRSELETIASEPDMAYPVENYAALDTLREILASKACPVPSTLPPTTTTEPPQSIQGCNGHKKLDVTWSISSQANAQETRLSINFIKGMIQDMTIDPDHIQVGLTPRLCDESEVKEGIRLQDHDTKIGFIAELDKRQLTGLRQTHQSIEYIWTTSKDGGRSDAVKYGILIVDNKLENWEQALKEAQRAKKDEIRLIVIGVGDKIQEDQLRQLSWSTETYFSIRNYSELADLKTQIIQTICKGITVQFNIKNLREYLEQF